VLPTTSVERHIKLALTAKAQSRQTVACLGIFCMPSWCCAFAFAVAAGLILWLPGCVGLVGDVKLQKINHIIFLAQENRSFDYYLAQCGNTGRRTEFQTRTLMDCRNSIPHPGRLQRIPVVILRSPIRQTRTAKLPLIAPTFPSSIYKARA